MMSVPNASRCGAFLCDQGDGMRLIVYGLMLVFLTACGKNEQNKAAMSAAPAGGEAPAPVPVGFYPPSASERPTLEVTYAQMTADIEAEMVLQSIGSLSDKTPKYFFVSKNGSVSMNLIGQKNDLVRVAYMFPNRYLDAKKAVIDLGVIGSGIRTAVPDCKDCFEWLMNAIGETGSNMKIIGNKRLTHENLNFVHMIIISHKESPMSMSIEDNPKQ